MSNTPETMPQQPDNATHSNSPDMNPELVIDSPVNGSIADQHRAELGKNSQEPAGVVPNVAVERPVPFQVAPPIMKTVEAPAVQSAVVADNAETTVLTEAEQLPLNPQPHSDGTPPGQGAVFTATADQPEKRKKSSALLAGIAIGAILGGLVGGGTAAVIAAQSPDSSQLTVTETPSITLNNTDSVSQVSAVASNITPSIVTLKVAGAQGSGSGSGVIYTEDGYIITNSHVATMSGATANPEIRVRLHDGTMLDATLVGTDPFADIAVVKVDATDLPAIKVADSEKLNVGQTAIAIGAPLNLSNTVTSGIVSALNRGISVANSMVPEGAEDQSQTEQNQQSPFPWDFQFEIPRDQEQQQQNTQEQPASRVAISVLQTDASINPGNSGGALLNDQGELIGVNVALAANGASAGTAGSDGLGFAIPANLAVRVADALIAGEQPSHGKLGISVLESVQDSDEDALREGALISNIIPGSAAERAGLKTGDVITSIAGTPVNSSTTASALIRYHEGGSTVSISYSREGVLKTIDAELDTLTW